METRLQIPPKDSDKRMYLNIHKMELERTKFMLKTYLRARIIKIERQLIYIIENDQASLMSEAEMGYAWTLYENKKKYFNEIFLNKIPGKLNIFE